MPAGSSTRFISAKTRPLASSFLIWTGGGRRLVISRAGSIHATPRLFAIQIRPSPPRARVAPSPFCCATPGSPSAALNCLYRRRLPGLSKAVFRSSQLVRRSPRTRFIQTSQSGVCRIPLMPLSAGSCAVEIVWKWESSNLARPSSPPPHSNGLLGNPMPTNRLLLSRPQISSS